MWMSYTASYPANTYRVWAACRCKVQKQQNKKNPLWPVSWQQLVICCSMLSLSISQLFPLCLCWLSDHLSFSLCLSSSVSHAFSLCFLDSLSLPHERQLFVEVSQHLMFAWHRAVMFTLLLFLSACLPPSLPLSFSRAPFFPPAFFCLPW